MRSCGIFLLVVLGCGAAFGTSSALAQTPAAPPAQKPAAARTPPDNRIGPAAFDARIVFASLGQDAQTAAELFTPAAGMASKAFGLSAGAHAYPLRGKSMALGIGAEAFIARNSFEPIDATTLKPGGTVFNRRLQGITGQLSMNFGHRMGWSYLTAGIGPMSFESHLAKLEPDGLREMTLNYGGGARWFNTDHLAFTVDLRFYETKPSLATANTAGRLRHKVFVMAAGISIK